ncbi:MAG: response regulator [Rhizobacter sp.]|nr:response regulator [Chlorobiales bacterium]
MPTSNEPSPESSVLKTILIADDEDLIRGWLSDVLEGEYDLLFAANGIDAMRLFLQNTDRIACVLTDYNMPEMGGEILIDQLRALKPSLPIIIMTGLERDREMNRLTETYGIKIIQKPFSLSELLELLKTAQ